MGKNDKQIRGDILEMLYREKSKGNDSLKLRDIAANIGVDYPTQAIPNADYLQGEGLIEYTSVGAVVSLTHEGLRRAEAGFGIPSFYTEEISSKTSNELRTFGADLNTRLATDAEPNSRHWILLKEKIDQVQQELDRREKKKLSTREKIYLAVGSGIALGGLVIALLQYLNCKQ